MTVAAIVSGVRSAPAVTVTAGAVTEVAMAAGVTVEFATAVAAGRAAVAAMAVCVTVLDSETVTAGTVTVVAIADGVTVALTTEVGLIATDIDAHWPEPEAVEVFVPVAPVEATASLVSSAEIPVTRTSETSVCDEAGV